jgi:hypothetical protein
VEREDIESFFDNEKPLKVNVFKDDKSGHYTKKRSELAPDPIFVNFEQVNFTCLIINSEICDIEELRLNGVKTKQIGLNGFKESYWGLLFHEIVDCADWAKSEFFPFFSTQPVPEIFDPVEYVFPKPPILIKSKIPQNLDAFRLHNWKVFKNWIISEKLKERLLKLKDADKYFTMNELELV